MFGCLGKLQKLGNSVITVSEKSEFNIFVSIIYFICKTALPETICLHFFFATLLCTH